MRGRPMPRRPPPATPPPAGDQSDQPTGDQGNEVYNERRQDRIWMPAYVMAEFGAEIGPYGVGGCLDLCHHVARGSNNCYPSLRVVGEGLGCSRSPLVRALHKLQGAGLVRIDPRLNFWGQRANRYTLTDPPPQLSARAGVGAHVGAPTRETGAPSPVDRGPLPSGERPPVSQKGQKEPGSENQDQRGSVPPPVAAHLGNLDQVERVAAAFMGQLVCSAPLLRAEQGREIRVEAAELLRRGYSVDHLLFTVYAADRDRTEFPRNWRKRVASTRPAQGRFGAPKKAQDMAKLAEERLQAARAVQELLKGKTVGEV